MDVGLDAWIMAFAPRTYSTIIFLFKNKGYEQNQCADTIFMLTAGLRKIMSF